MAIILVSSMIIRAIGPKVPICRILRNNVQDLFRRSNPQHPQIGYSVKRLKSVSTLEQAGCKLLPDGTKHNIYHNPISGKSQPVPRHRKISEHLDPKDYQRTYSRIMLTPIWN